MLKGAQQIGIQKASKPSSMFSTEATLLRAMNWQGIPPPQQQPTQYPPGRSYAEDATGKKKKSKTEPFIQGM